MAFNKSHFIMAAFLFLYGLSIPDTVYGDERFYEQQDSQPIREEKAEGLIDHAIAFYKEHGRDKALAEFGKSDGLACQQYKHDPSGLIVKTQEGKILSYCKYHCLVGKYVHDLKTPDGSRPFHLIHEAFIKNPKGLAKAEIVTNRNPFTNKVTRAKILAKKHDGLMFMNIVYDDKPLEGFVPDDNICDQGRTSLQK